ncbi:MAG: hypothetical protein ACKPKO_21170 [Candidatus Fonsibacter sp.]
MLYLLIPLNTFDDQAPNPPPSTPEVVEQQPPQPKAKAKSRAKVKAKDVVVELVAEPVADLVKLKRVMTITEANEEKVKPPSKAVNQQTVE